MSKDSEMNYNGLNLEKMVKEYRGEVAYNQEVDIHFPHLTVGETLEFAAYARAPHERGRNISRDGYVKTVVQVVMAVFGLSHTYNTKVGNDFIRGCSGGERKRVRSVLVTPCAFPRADNCQVSQRWRYLVLRWAPGTTAPVG